MSLQNQPGLASLAGNLSTILSNIPSGSDKAPASLSSVAPPTLNVGLVGVPAIVGRGATARTRPVPATRLKRCGWVAAKEQAGTRGRLGADGEEPAPCGER